MEGLMTCPRACKSPALSILLGVWAHDSSIVQELVASVLCDFLQTIGLALKLD